MQSNMQSFSGSPTAPRTLRPLGKHLQRSEGISRPLPLDETEDLRFPGLWKDHAGAARVNERIHCFGHGPQDPLHCLDCLLPHLRGITSRRSKDLQPGGGGYLFHPPCVEKPSAGNDLVTSPRTSAETVRESSTTLALGEREKKNQKHTRGFVCLFHCLTSS